ncbi:hypothetical protein VTN31DRAFT_4409 [Thermomyces dupontii]|uniref:uncharacterized protein n=1 Tax=Talaromyces thermophilus TaxID=28565 RepID=UPI00374319C6
MAEVPKLQKSNQLEKISANPPFETCFQFGTLARPGLVRRQIQTFTSFLTQNYKYPFSDELKSFLLLQLALLFCAITSTIATTMAPSLGEESWELHPNPYIDIFQALVQSLSAAVTPTNQRLRQDLRNTTIHALYGALSSWIPTHIGIDISELRTPTSPLPLTKATAAH